MWSKARSSTCSTLNYAARIQARSRPSRFRCPDISSSRKPQVKKTTVALALSMMAGVALAQAPGESTAWRAVECDHACLSQFVRDYMAALVKRNPASLKVAKTVRFTENDVELPFGKEGFWATVTAVAPTGLVAADTQTGNAAWVGTAEENGKPVYFGVRLAIRDKAIAEAETIVVRNTGLPAALRRCHQGGARSHLQRDPAAGAAPLARTTACGGRWLLQYRRAERRQCVHAFRSWTVVASRTAFSPLRPRPVPAGAISPGCEAQFKLGIYRINKRIRERRYPHDRCGTRRGGGNRLLRSCQ